MRRTASGYALASVSKSYTPPWAHEQERNAAYTRRPPWRLRMNRRMIRSLKRYIVWMLVCMILVMLWRELGNSGEDETPSTPRRPWRKKNSRPRDTWHRSWPGWNGIRKIYALYVLTPLIVKPQSTNAYQSGDSHTDYNFDPDGDEPTGSNPIGNPAFPGLTACYGPNYLSHLTANYNASQILTYNLARPGSTIRNSRHVADLDPFGQGMGLDDQIEKLFLANYGHSAAPGSKSGWRQDETLFVFYAGVDESMYDFIARGNDTARNMTEVDLDMQAYWEGLEKAYENGARNFLIIGIPGLEESPLMRNCGITKTLNRFGAELTDLNGRIAFMVQLFAHAHAEDATVFFYNNHKTSIITRNDAKTFEETKGIQRMEGYCYFYEDKKEVIEFDPACKNPLEEFYWRDTKHHTEPFHRLMARTIVELLEDVSNALPYEFY